MWWHSSRWLERTAHAEARHLVRVVAGAGAVGHLGLGVRSNARTSQPHGAEPHLVSSHNAHQVMTRKTRSQTRRPLAPCPHCQLDSGAANLGSFGVRYRR